MLPHTVTLVRPSTGLDGYGDPAGGYDAGATRLTITARLAQTAGRENTNNRDAQISEWRMLTNHLDISGNDRVEWNGATFEIVGPPELPTDLSGAPHHAEAALRLVTG